MNMKVLCILELCELPRVLVPLLFNKVGWEAVPIDELPVVHGLFVWEKRLWFFAQKSWNIVSTV
jgi:hypothetical protein